MVRDLIYDMQNVFLTGLPAGIDIDWEYPQSKSHLETKEQSIAAQERI